MPVPHNPILDLDVGIGQTKSSFVYRVLDQNLNIVDEIKVLEPPTISATTTASVKRRLSNFVLSEEDYRRVDRFRCRIMPVMVLEDGTEWPMGVYYFVQTPINVGTYISKMEASLMDGDYLLSLGIRYPYGVPPGGSIVTAIHEILDSINISHRNVPVSTSKIVADPLNWAIDTPRMTMLTVLCNLAGWMPPYFDNRGTCVIRAPADPRWAEPDHLYETRRIKAGSIFENDNLLTAPNVYVVISTGPSKGDISASAEVSASLDFSVQNRGYEVIKVYRTQGLTSTQQAQEMATNMAVAGTNGLKQVQFTGSPDPRHDLFDSIEYDGGYYTESEWSLTLKAGSDHSHSMTSGGFKFDA